MELKEYLGLWNLTEDERGSVPLLYDDLCRAIAHIGCTVPSYKLVMALEANGLIEATARGARILSEKGVAVRKSVPALNVVHAPVADDVNAESKWTVFRNLCNYYAACERLSEREQDALFTDDLNNKFLFPQLVGNWLDAPDRLPLPRSRQNSPAISYISVLGGSGGRQIFLGYPLWSKLSYNAKKLMLFPVLMFPAELEYDELRGEYFIKLRVDEADLNRTWLEKNFEYDRDERNAIERSILRNRDGTLRLTETLQAFENRFSRGGNGETLDPRHLRTDVNFGNRKINNAAALFLEGEMHYTKTLLRELKQISNEPAAVLNQTALRYVFKTPPDPVLPEIQRGNADGNAEKSGALIGTADAEILPAQLLASGTGNFFNKEQFEALVEALNLPVSKLQGPPGTGKSQVAVGLIANLVLRKKSALFTSKNRKAVTAIYERCEKINAAQQAVVSGNPLPPLVRFCINPDGTSGGNDWRKSDDDEFVSNTNFKPALRWLEQNAADFFGEDFPKNWAREREKIRAIDRARAALADAELALAQALRNAFGETEKTPADAVADLDSLKKNRFRALTGTLRLKSGKFLFRHFCKDRVEQRLRAAEVELKATFPQFRANVSRKRLCLKISRFTRALRCVGKCAETVKILRAELDVAEKAVPAETRDDLVDMLKKEIPAAQKILAVKRLSAARNFFKDTPANGEKSRAEKIRDVFWKWVAREPLGFQRSMPPDKNSDDEKPFNEVSDAVAEFLKISPAWATPLLSLSHASPCIPAAFDRVIIDEAAQCEIPPIIPALFRAKGVTVIGDPEQFPPVITLDAARNAFLLKKHNIDSAIWDFRRNTAYSVVARERHQPVILRDQWRSNAEIVNYGNAGFYNGELESRQDIAIPPGAKRALEWIETDGTDAADLAAVRERMDTLARNGFAGTIGIISPLRKIVDALRRMLGIEEQNLPKEFDVQRDVNTVNAFQGGERDVIIYVLGLTAERRHGDLWYITSDENNYVHNVAVSRARANCVVIGNRNLAENCGNDKVRKLVECATREQHRAKKSFGSMWEEKFFDALVANGFDKENLKTQFPLRGRWLDIALVAEKIDVEIDGVAWHTTSEGRRKMDDYFRDVQVESAGWRVCRFWANEVRDRLNDCVAELSRMARTGDRQQSFP